MSWRDSIQRCDDVPIEVCNAKSNSGECDACTIDRVLEALKAKGYRYYSKDGYVDLPDVALHRDVQNLMLNRNGWLVFIPDETKEGQLLQKRGARG